MKTYVLFIPEMTCQHCVNTITRILESNDLHDYKFNLDQHLLTLSTDNIEKVTLLLSEAGYESTIKN